MNHQEKTITETGRKIFGALVATMFLLATAGAVPPQSDHGEMVAVPAPGKVVVDGSIGAKEWDLTGEMFVYSSAKIRTRNSVRVYSMWDKDALYLGLKWRDPSAMFNDVDPDAAPGEGWQADCFQGRFITDTQVHLTAWYSSVKNKSVAQFNYDNAMANPKIFLGDGTTVKESGFEMAFKKDADGKGYTQEMRIPWALLYKNGTPPQDKQFTFTGEYFWGGPTGKSSWGLLWSDPINQELRSRIVLFQSPQAWGKMRLLDQGNLPPKPVEEDDSRLQGPMTFRFPVPEGAKKFSLVIEDDKGVRVRNLLGHASVEEYLDPGSKDKKAIAVKWDGRADGKWDRNRSLFLGDIVPEGRYRARVMFHKGIGVVHAGSFYNPGSPTWHTLDGRGGWAYDHSSPSAVAAMPASAKSKGRVFIGAHHGEQGVGFFGLDADGQKIWEWIKRSAGAHHIAADEKDAYFAFVDLEGPKLGKVSPDTGAQNPLGEGGPLEIKLPAKPTGLALTPKLAVVAVVDKEKQEKGRLLVFEKAGGRQTGDVPVENPRQLIALPDGRIGGLCGTKDAFVFDPASGKVETFAIKAVAEPASLASDSQGRIYVYDMKEQQVTVLERLAADAKKLGTIGEPGGHVPGPWNRNRMNPAGDMAVEERADGSRRLWVTEPSAMAPRRVSVWTTDGKFVREFIGNTRYMSTNAIMSDDIPDLGICDGLIMKVDYKNRSFEAVELMGGVPEPKDGRRSLFHMYQMYGLSFANGYHFLSKASGQEREYYVEGNAFPRVFMRRNGRWVCVAAMGRADYGLQDTAPIPKASGLPQGTGPQSVFVWNDLNGDGFQSADEIQWRDFPEKNFFGTSWGYRPDRDLTWYYNGYAFKPARFSADGAPIYDLQKVEKLPGDAGKFEGEMYRTKFGWFGSRPDPKHNNMAGVDDNGVVFGLYQDVGFDRSGRLVWTYPNYWVAVHGGSSAPAPQPGVKMGGLKVTGIVEGKKHDVISVRNNMGQEQLIRDDGMYVGELFTDLRDAPDSMPATADCVGVAIDNVSMEGESFSGWMGRQRDGKVRMTYGRTDGRIAEVLGLDGMIDIEAQAFAVDKKWIEKFQAFKPKISGDDQATPLVAKRGGPLAAEPKTFDAPGAAVIRSGKTEVAKAVLSWDDKNLYVAWKVYDTSPMLNKGADAVTSFKTGDSVNLFLAPAREYPKSEINGTRVLLTQLNDKPVAVVYKPRGPGRKEFVFESPVRKSPFEYASVEAAVSFDVKKSASDYIVTATIPWSVLDVIPSKGLKLQADVGVLFGDQTGANTAERVQRSDKETNIVNDIPSEAEFFPGRWTVLELAE